MIIEFTKSLIETGLIVPDGADRSEICDSVVRGLCIQLNSKTKTEPRYQLRYKRAGKTAYESLGSVRELSLSQVRKLAIQKKVEFAPFAKVVPEVKPAVGAMTLDDFWTDHYLPHAKLHKRSWKRDDQLYRLWIKEKFGNSKLADLKRSQFLQYQAELATTILSPASQDHVIKQARRLLSYATELELIERNPLKGIRLRMVPNELHDVTDSEGLRRYVNVLLSDSNRPVCNVLLFALSSGARLGEILKLTDDQLDMEKGLWTIPAANAKSKKSRTVPLNDSALYVLAEAYKLKKTQYVFANPATGLPFVTITRVRHRLQRLAQVQIRAHTLRHQFADMLLEGGKSLYDVQILLGHSDPRVSQRYARPSLSRLQQASSVASILVPKPQPPATPDAATVASPPQPEVTAIPEQAIPKGEATASNIVL